MHACGYFIHIKSVLDMTVNLYISVSGESWSIKLKDSRGTVEASISGYGYNYYSLTATSYGSHTLELTCNWNAENPCEVCPVDIPPVYSTPKPPEPPYSAPSLPGSPEPPDSSESSDKTGLFTSKNILIIIIIAIAGYMLIKR